MEYKNKISWSMKEGCTCTWPTQGPNICSLSHSPNIQRRISIFSLVNIYIDLPCTYFFIQTSLSTRQFILISLRTHPSFCAQFDGTHIKKFSGLIEFTYCRRLVFLIECRIPFWEPSLNLTFSLMTVSVLLAIFLVLGRYHQFNSKSVEEPREVLPLPRMLFSRCELGQQ